eukprot:4682190-Pyramimonas_sp.AAC.1
MSTVELDLRRAMAHPRVGGTLGTDDDAGSAPLHGPFPLGLAGPFPAAHPIARPTRDRDPLRETPVGHDAPMER